MKIVEKYSHLNGLEYLLVHRPKLWNEIKNVIKTVDAEKCKTKISKEKSMKGTLLYSPIEMNESFKKELTKYRWEESRVSYWVTKDEKLIRKTLTSVCPQSRLLCGQNCAFAYANAVFKVVCP